MGLFKPAWQGKNPKVRIKAIAKEKNQENILQIAMTDVDEVAPFAVDKLTSQNDLAKVVMSAKSWLAIKHALNKITDQSIISDIIFNSENSTVNLCVQKLTDENIYADYLIKTLTLQKRISLKITSDKEWCIFCYDMHEKSGMVVVNRRERCPRRSVTYRQNHHKLYCKI